MSNELSHTELRLVQANKQLRAQNQDLTAENDDLLLRCEKLQSMVERLVAELAEPRDRSVDNSSVDNSYALVTRPDSSAGPPTEPSEFTKQAFEATGVLISEHEARIGQLEARTTPDGVRTSPQGGEFGIERLVSNTQDLERRIALLEAQTDGASGGDSEAVKQDKKVIRALDQLRELMHRIESREKHEREIDMADTRERLYELFHHLSRNQNDGTVRRSGPFEGTCAEFFTLRDRVVNRLAGLEAYDKAFMEAKVAVHNVHKTRGR